MGSYITLGIEELELDWGKNFSYRDYSKLFLKSDRIEIPYYYADDEVVFKPGYSRNLKRVKERLELLGYSLKNLETHFKSHNELYPSYLDQPEISYDTLLAIFSKIDVAQYKNTLEDGDYDLGEYVIDNIFKNESFKELRSHIDVESRDIGSYFENLDPLFTLRLLIENPKNLELNLQWRTQDIIDGGWVSEEELFVGVLESNQTLIVTEGSSDSFVIKKSLELLRPDIQDFFGFVDMEDNYPFTGTGNLYRFCQGLSSIRIQNKILVIFDNDLEGLDSFNKTNELNLPTNMRTMRLPDSDEFSDFSTVGPSGESLENINGKAVAIECFLDLSKSSPMIRWTNYKRPLGAYQGSLENKDSYIRTFKDIRSVNDKYDFKKLNLLIDAIYEKCI